MWNARPANGARLPATRTTTQTQVGTIPKALLFIQQPDAALFRSPRALSNTSAEHNSSCHPRRHKHLLVKRGRHDLPDTRHQVHDAPVPGAPPPMRPPTSPKSSRRRSPSKDASARTRVSASPMTSPTTSITSSAPITRAAGRQSRGHLVSFIPGVATVCQGETQAGINAETQRARRNAEGEGTTASSLRLSALSASLR
jgi:hypothetical protein